MLERAGGVVMTPLNCKVILELIGSLKIKSMRINLLKIYHLIGNIIFNTCLKDTKKISGDVSTEIIKIAYL